MNIADSFKAAVNIIYGLSYKRALIDERISALLVTSIILTKNKTGRDMAIIAADMYLRGEM